MTVSELIAELQKLPSDLPVVVRGYEGGVDDVDKIEEVNIILNANCSWYYGQHEEAYWDKEAPSVPAIQLSGNNKLAK